MDQWLPKSVIELRHYSPKTFVSDVIAGVSVALITLPLAMAIAITSGVPPQRGLCCAIVAGFLVFTWGGSLTQICGPAGAFVVLAYSIVAKLGMDGLSLCTLMAGVILVILGVTGLGAAVRFMPLPVIAGFRNGIAIVVLSTQLKDFFGIKISSVPPEFWARIEMLAKHFRAFSPVETSLSVVTVALIFLFTFYVKKVPGYVIALFTGTALTLIFKLPVETIATRFGGVPSGLQVIPISYFRPEILPFLVSPAIAVATLSAIVAPTSPVVSGRMTGSTQSPDRGLIGLGIANTVSAFFGGLPVTGTMVRTEANICPGAKTPVAGILHALVLLVFVLFAAPLIAFIPLSVLAAILLAAACRMGEWHEIPALLKLSKLEIGVWLMTCLLTIFADLTVAVEGGMILALLMFIRKATSTSPVVTIVREQHIEKGHTIQ